MKLILIVGFLVVCPVYQLVDANWCIEEVTRNLKVTKVLTRIRTSRRWYGGTKRKTVAYTVTELVPTKRKERVCCSGYSLNEEHKICQPRCDAGCPEFAQCSSPNVCLCEQGFEKNNATGLCVDSSSLLHSTTTENNPTTLMRNDPVTTQRSSTRTGEEVASTIVSSTGLTPSNISQQQSLSSEEPERTTIGSSSSDPSPCGNEACSGGKICVNGLCKCPDGLDFSDISKTCINITCESFCQNGTCLNNGECKCFEGFVSQEDGSCRPKCDRECLNGECVAPGKCECLEGYGFKPENIFECVVNGSFSGELKRINDDDDDDDDFDSSWIWALVTITTIAVLGLFLIRMSKKRSYDVDKTEKSRHFVKFENSGEQQSD